MGYAIALLFFLSCCVTASARPNGFFLGGFADGTNNNMYDPQALQRQYELERQRQLIEQNNRILQDMQDKQQRLDSNRIFGIHR